MSDPFGTKMRQPQPTVYLCGPITGISATASTGWRRCVATTLGHAVNVIDPTRDVPDSTPNSEHPANRSLSIERLLHGKAVVARDRFDIQRSDIVLACFLGATRVSIGAVGEVFWADAMRKPVIIVREDDNVHNHDMLNEIAAWIFADLESAIEQIRRLIHMNDHQ